jgi:hypothetical protein
MSAIAYLFLLPMLAWAASTFLPLKVNAEMTSFTGKYLRWRIEHYTGVVLASSTVAHTYGTVTYGDGGPRHNVSTDLHNNVRLRLATGAQQEIHLVNFGHTCRPGDVVTVWYARKGRKSTPFAALNLTTNQQYKPPRGSGIGLVILSHTLLFPLLFVLTGFASFLAGGAGVFLFFLTIVIVGTGWNLTRRRFLKTGMKPLWQRSRDEARSLQPATS